IVDVTADQFTEGQPTIIVTASSSWHTQTWRWDDDAHVLPPIRDWTPGEPWRAWLLRAVAVLRGRGALTTTANEDRRVEPTACADSCEDTAQANESVDLLMLRIGLSGGQDVGDSQPVDRRVDIDLREREEVLGGFAIAESSEPVIGPVVCDVVK